MKTSTFILIVVLVLCVFGIYTKKQNEESAAAEMRVRVVETAAPAPEQRILVTYRPSEGAETRSAAASSDAAPIVALDPVQAENAAGERSAPAETPAPEIHTYILNTNTRKFHYPSCSSVKQMKDSNKSEKTCTREEVIAMGYEPCGKCHP